MSSYFTTSKLIADVERRAHIPGAQVTFKQEDYLAFANEEMMIGLVPSMMQFHEEFFVQEFIVDLQSTQSAYPVPERAIGGKIRNLFFMDSAGNFKELGRILPEDIVYYQRRSSINYPHVYYIQNNSIVLVPEVSNNIAGQLRFDVFVRPNELVDESRAATVVSIDTTNQLVTLSNIPKNFAIGGLIDIIETKGGHRWKGMDIEITSINTSTKTIGFTFPTLIDTPFDIVIGDYINSAGESVIPQVPDELHSVLSQRIACRCLEAQGDAAGLQAANTKLVEMELRMGNLIDNRSEGQPMKIVNLRGPLRASKIRRRRNMW